MIVGIGNDLVETRRIAEAIARNGDKFLERCFTENERAKADSRSDEKVRIGTYAKRFATKEACAKALGTGIAGGITFQDFDITNNAAGAPELTLSGEALSKLKQLTPAGYHAHIHLSCTDDGAYAQAFVVIEARIG